MWYLEIRKCKKGPYAWDNIRKKKMNSEKVMNKHIHHVFITQGNSLVL